MFDLSGRTALVTGASGGLGTAIARALHQQGAVVTLSGTRKEALDALAGELGERVHVVPCDLADTAAVEQLVPGAEAAMGSLDILVNNAGLTRDGLAMRMKLGERARAKKLTPDEVQRGTFTITNPGRFGSFAGTPIINQPQVAILGIGSIEKRPHVVTLPDGTDTLAIRTKGMFTMAYDHRIVDGADADRFLADLKAMLQAFPDTAA